MFDKVIQRKRNIWLNSPACSIQDLLGYKIHAFNEKSFANSSEKKPYKPLTISENRLELIEFLSLDCTAVNGERHSDHELRLTNLVTSFGVASNPKDFWDGTISADCQPLRLRIRNICGDETIWWIENA